MVGGLIMAHGDDNGLRVPPRLAPMQVVVLAVKGDEAVVARSASSATSCGRPGVRVEVDDRADMPFGRRAVDWELKGVPVRVEVGPRDLANGTAMLVRRIPGGKAPVALDALVDACCRGAGGGPGAAAAAVRASAGTSRTVGRDDDGRGGRGGGRPAGPGCRGRSSARRARPSWPSRRVTVRCLVAEDGSVPDSDDAPGNIAIVARAY